MTDKSDKKENIVFTGGGTAGHIMPCVALINELKGKFNIHYIGSYNGMERELISSIKEVKYYGISTVKFIRSFSLKNIMIPFKLIKGIMQAKKLLKQIKPAVAFSKGGFVALPVALACKCPLICHESDKSIGLSNRLTKNKACYFCTSYQETSQKAKNGVFTGLPIRQNLYFKGVKPAKSRPVLLIMGGSLGAKAINGCIEKCADNLTKKYEVIHITGKGKSLESLKGLKNYTQIEFCHDMAGLYSKADVCLSRGGGTALYELIALKIPSVIVPLPKGASRGDQLDNAAYFKSRNLCYVIPEEELTPGGLLQSIEKCLNDKALAVSLGQAKNIDGTKKITDLIINTACKAND